MRAVHGRGIPRLGFLLFLLVLLQSATPATSLSFVIAVDSIAVRVFCRPSSLPKLGGGDPPPGFLFFFLLFFFPLVYTASPVILLSRLDCARLGTRCSWRLPL